MDIGIRQASVGHLGSNWTIEDRVISVFISGKQHATRHAFRHMMDGLIHPTAKTPPCHHPHSPALPIAQHLHPCLPAFPPSKTYPHILLIKYSFSLTLTYIYLLGSTGKCVCSLSTSGSHCHASLIFLISSRVAFGFGNAGGAGFSFGSGNPTTTGESGLLGVDPQRFSVTLP